MRGGGVTLSNAVGLTPVLQRFASRTFHQSHTSRSHTCDEQSPLNTNTSPLHAFKASSSKVIYSQSIQKKTCDNVSFKTFSNWSFWCSEVDQRRTSQKSHFNISVTHPKMILLRLVRLCSGGYCGVNTRIYTLGLENHNSLQSRCSCREFISHRK